MKIAIFFAILALALAAEEKQEEKKTAEKQSDEKPIVEIRRGLVWPLPDWSNEGDLMLQGVHFYERVGELRQVKNFANDVDRMVLAFGRDFLRRAHRYLFSTPDFKILPTLCRDSRTINSTDRWEIRIEADQPEQGKAEEKTQNDASLPKEEQKEQNDQTHPRSMARPVNATENVTESVIPKEKVQLTIFQAQNHVHYERMGTNFARLFMKKYRKEALLPEETEYLERWSSDEAVHYGSMGIYCSHRGEEKDILKEIVKQLNIFIEEKP